MSFTEVGGFGGGGRGVAKDTLDVGRNHIQRTTKGNGEEVWTSLLRLSLLVPFEP